MEDRCHVLLVLFPGSQGQINPSLQFAKRLVNLGVKVTLSTSLHVISNCTAIPGIDFAPISDGHDDGDKKVTPDGYGAKYNSFKTRGSQYVATLVKAKAADGAPFTRIIYTTLMQWVGEVARSLHVPATLLWIQPAAVLDVYYSYFTDCQDLFKSCGENGVVQIPGLPALGTTDFPSFMFSKATTNNTLWDWAIQAMKDQIDLINSEDNPKILVNTFDDLEVDALRAIKKMTLIGIGPLVPSAYLDGKDPSDTSFGGDLLEKSDDYVEWLDSQPKSSVIYVAFGSYADLKTTMVEQIAQALMESKMPFLWVLRETSNGEKPEGELRCKEELEKQGKIVRWCTQIEVLQHSSIGCFLTHCGWNSTIESLVFGMPVVACPLWGDQSCNAKLVQDVWKTGARVKANEDGIVESRELKRCLECVMGEGGVELRKNAKKWRDLARTTMKEGGSSYFNLKAYVHEVLLN
ncbi:PREDICTED: crocetin glucosyltransferase, chloroplastic-like [Ipomoea nil]|uniref:crocetin glucosyltransferase, chloroplastic-like n=1 Tax=Ipomoea nil TaxID=35883 RepID=UPI000901C651|nr:PREDICTED: crocetin glucosyltransferase, chloroplastic-like [Ipomoea nil]